MLVLRNSLIGILFFCLCIQVGFAVGHEGEYSSSSFGFIENRGQFVTPDGNSSKAIRYLLPLSNMNIQVQRGGFSYDCFAFCQDENDRLERASHRIDIEFLGANPNHTVEALEVLPGALFFDSNKPNLSAKHFSKVLYHDLYPGIDLELLTHPDNREDFKFNFIVHPGADATLIRWQYTGADRVALKQGNIQIDHAHGSVKEKIPHSYLQEDGQEVNIGYQHREGTIFGFSGLNENNGTNTLVIDPVPLREWGTYIQKPFFYSGLQGFAADQLGNTYLCSFLTSSIFFVTTGAHQTTLLGTSDITIQKFRPSGTLEWATYFGGNGGEYWPGISTGPHGNVYVYGYTDSNSGLSTTGSHQTALSGMEDGFVAKFNTQGVLQWSTYYGGANEDGITGLAADTSGNVYFTGFTRSPNGISTPGSFQPNLWASFDVDMFVVKMDSNGNRQWGTYYGGSGTERPGPVNALAVNDAGQIAIGGYARSTTMATPGAFSSVGNTTTSFASLFDPLGNRVWFTYFGDADETVFSEIAIDAQGYVYMGGYTKAFSGISSPNAHQPIHGSFPAFVDFDGFLVKFGLTGNQEWGTYYGGDNTDKIWGLKINSQGDLVCSGTTGSLTNISTPNAFQPFKNNSNGFLDGFIANFTPLGGRNWGTYLGGTDVEMSAYLGLTPSGDIYTAGITSSDDGIATPNAYSTFHNGSTKGFLLKFSQPNLSGRAYIDLNGNCQYDSTDFSAFERTVVAQPGNFVTQTGPAGEYFFDLPVGSYTIEIDTSGPWTQICPANPFHQSVVLPIPDTLINGIDFALLNTAPCSKASVTIAASAFRPCFSTNQIMVTVSNSHVATQQLDSSYVILELPNLTPLTSSIPYISLGNDSYRFETGTLNPGDNAYFTLTCSLSCDIMIGYTQCINAALYPVDSCALAVPPTNSNCGGPWDFSHIQASAYCLGDSLIDLILVNRESDMQCSQQVRIYRDSQLYLVDSIMLVSGDSMVYTILADGKTWRIEADQHPLHPGVSMPSATIEACGDSLNLINNWIPGLVNTLPMNDIDDAVDIFCLQTTASYDPNDKRGFPLGIGTDHLIEPNTRISYMIRFQNTGNDTAFNVSIVDTLPDELDLLTFTSTVSSHPYTVELKGQGIVEWTFSNILLPDSNVNEPGSNGFVTFEIAQQPNLPNGTLIDNIAHIYFDFNPAIITPLSRHQIGYPLSVLGCDYQATLLDSDKGLFALPSNPNFGYQWYSCSDNTPVPGANQSYFIPSQIGDYYAVISNAACNRIDTTNCIDHPLLSSQTALPLSIQVYPNPSKGELFAAWPPTNAPVHLSVFNAIGKKVGQFLSHPSENELRLDLSWLENGVYFLEFTSNGQRYFKKVVLQD